MKNFKLKLWLRGSEKKRKALLHVEAFPLEIPIPTVPKLQRMQIILDLLFVSYK